MRRAFTLVELMVVIAIMALLAGLIVALAKYATDRKKISRVETELTMWVTLIEYYHDKMGFYPPCNTNNPALNPLYYELSGMVLGGTIYTNQNGADTIERSVLTAAFNLGGLLNASTDPGEVRRFGTIKQTDLVTVTTPTGAAVKVPRVPVPGLGPFGEPTTTTNTWYYNSVNPAHNPGSYDLWAVYLIGGQLRTNGNWKR